MRRTVVCVLALAACLAWPAAAPALRLIFMMPSGVSSLSLYLKPVVVSFQHGLPAHVPPAGMNARETSAPLA